MTSQGVYYSVSGVVANERISPLLPSDWIDVTEGEASDIVPDFLWENAPRRETKAYRDSVKVYSHLPNGTSLLDSKWALGRLFAHSRDPLVGALETHCFRGLDGFASFARKVNLTGDRPKGKKESLSFDISSLKYPDITDKRMDLSTAPDANQGPGNLWVVKDAMANGAGGVWVVGPEIATTFAATESTPIYPEHKYVAQRYAWPPVLFDGRKCHVRCYALMTSDGRAWVHHRSFLHVANDPFTTTDANETGSFRDSIHITNCCANSHDASKFAGEILADFEESEYSERDGQLVVPLAAFFPSISKCISHLAQDAFPFLQGGQANHGFEYMGIDFMLSYNESKQPLAYILEINAPPSQDSATGLPHAENLHNQVIRDLTTLWVLPHVIADAPETPGGWRCVYEPQKSSNCDEGELIVPSKATIINKIRWSIFEKKAEREQDNDAKAQQHVDLSNGTKPTLISSHPVPADQVSAFARSQFPYFSDAAASSHSQPQVFVENAGGSQVAQSVIDTMVQSLQCRHRSRIGSNTKRRARRTMRRILGAHDDDIMMLGPNATSLIASLADEYVRYELLQQGDEVIVSTENHTANYDPWIRAAKDSGAVLKYWTPFGGETAGSNSSNILQDLVTRKTRILAIPHASNVLGQVRDVASISKEVKRLSGDYCHLVVDGVASVPHYFADLSNLNHVDWYVISCHKLFGPHLGAMFGRRATVQMLLHDALSPLPVSDDDDSSLYQRLEKGTINYEGCAGVVGLGSYFVSLASYALSSYSQKSIDEPQDSAPAGEVCSEDTESLQHEINIDLVREAYSRIRAVEIPLLNALLHGLSRFSKVRILGGDKAGRSSNSLRCVARLPTVSFVHENLPPHKIVSACKVRGISCRCSFFLCTSQLAKDFDFDRSEGVVRISLVHYNTLAEVDYILQVLANIPGWS